MARFVVRTCKQKTGPKLLNLDPVLFYYRASEGNRTLGTSLGRR